MEFEFELIENEISPNPYLGNSLTFKAKIDFAKHAAILDTKVLGVRVDLSAFKDKIHAGAYGRVERRNSPCYNFLTDILLKKPTEVRNLTETLFHVHSIFMKEGSATEQPLNIGFEFLPVQYKSWPVINYRSGTAFIQVKQPQIAHFNIYPSIVRRNSKIRISASCHHVDQVEIWGNQGQVLYKSADFELMNDSCRFFLTEERAPVTAQKEITYYLKASLKHMYATEHSAKTIKVLSNGDWQPMAILENHVPEDYQGPRSYGKAVLKTIALVQNTYKDRIWIIVQGIDTPDLYQLWSSADGLDWQPYQSKGKTVEIPLAYIYTPAVFFQNALFFVGGSLIDSEFSSNELYRIDLETGTSSLIKNETQMEPCSQHACTVFPDREGKDNIWVIGGMDAGRSALNAIWRFDGYDWHEEEIPEDFPERSLPGITVQKNKDGLPISIWLAGGKQFNGSDFDDIWQYAANDEGTMSWTQIKRNADDSIHFAKHENIYATTLTYLDTLTHEPKIAVVFNHQRSGNLNNVTDIIHLRSKDKATEESEIRTYVTDEIPDGGKGLPIRPHNEDSFVLQSVGFNGCIWCIALFAYPNNYDSSGLYFSCPQ